MKTLKHVLPSVAVLFVLLPCRTRAFADYLLRGSGCWTALSPDEVIMNHAVVDAESVEGDNLRIIVEGHQVSSDNQHVVVSGFPQTVHVKVGGESANIKDYQYVIDVINPEEVPADGADAAASAGPAAAFEGGSCTNQWRVSGRANDAPRTLVVHRAGARIVAGWATGHEAVKLTKVITFVSSSSGGGAADSAVKAESASLDDKKKEPDWTSALVEACPEVVEAGEVGAFPIVQSPVKLHAAKAERENEVQLKWPVDTPNPKHLVLVSSSTDATFQGGVCGGLSAPEHAGPRLVLAANGTTEEIAIPVLSIHKPHTVKVYAYTFDGTSHSIQRTEPFVLTWVPDTADQRKEEAAHDKKKVDPQTLADAKVRADPQQLRQQAQAHAYLGKDRVGSGSDKSPVHARDDQDERKGQIHHLSQEESVVDDDAASLDQHPGHRKDGIGALQHDNSNSNQQQRNDLDKRKPQAHRRGFHHTLLHHDATNSGQPLHFSVGSSYYAGVAILVVAPIAVVQLCLRASRKAKGRRSL